MTLNLNVPKAKEQLSPRITVIGVGGAGGNAVNNMIQSNLEGVEFMVANTDAQSLTQTYCERSIQLGRNITQGLGAGSRPDIGRAAAEEALDEILSQLEGSNMVFVTAGMGGGTGTGAAPVIARAAREAGILTVGVVTKPFHFEGVHRMRLAEAGMTELQQYVDTLIVIPNQNLFRVANEKTTFADAFKMADDVLDAGVRGVTDLMVMPGLINLDFADIRAVMTEMGKAMMGTGEAEGENRSIDAAEAAISNPLLDDVSMKGARGVLINITGGADMTLFEVDEAANRIRDEVDPEANIIFGSTFVESLEGRMRVSVVATGIDADEIAAPRPAALSLVSSRANTRPAAGPESGYQAPASSSLGLAPTVRPSEERPVESDEFVDHTAIELPGGLIRSAAPPRPSSDQAEREMPQTAIAEQPNEIGRDDRPSGTGRVEEGFIAPPPVEPDIKRPLFAEAAVTSNPFAEAELTNSGNERSGEQSRPSAAPRRRKAHGLFAKMSDAARAFQGASQAEALEEFTPERDPEPAQAQPSAPMPPRGGAVGQGAQVTQQPRFSGLDPAERIASSAAEEELLDIPAFLRRQAN